MKMAKQIMKELTQDTKALAFHYQKTRLVDVFGYYILTLRVFVKSINFLNIKSDINKRGSF